MDLLAHALAEGGVDQLVTLDAALAGELRLNHHRLEVLAVAEHFDVLARETAFDALFHAFWSHHLRSSVCSRI